MKHDKRQTTEAKAPVVLLWSEGVENVDVTVGTGISGGHREMTSKFVSSE
jgi:hypothetical protein